MPAPTRYTFIAACALAASAPAAADTESTIAGTYRVALTEVVDSCDEGGLEIDEAELRLRSEGGGEVTAELSSLPTLAGSERNGGQFRVEARAGESPIENAAGQYELAGRVRAGEVESLVLVAQYFRDDEPLCTQSWSGAGAD